MTRKHLPVIWNGTYDVNAVEMSVFQLQRRGKDRSKCIH